MGTKARLFTPVTALYDPAAWRCLVESSGAVARRGPHAWRAAVGDVPSERVGLLRWRSILRVRPDPGGGTASGVCTECTPGSSSPCGAPQLALRLCSNDSNRLHNP